MKLKRFAVPFLLVMIPCSIFAFLGYETAEIKNARDQVTALAWQKTTFFVSVMALEELKTNGVDAATKDMQKICFANAHKIMTSQPFAHDELVIAFGFKLLKYFDTYCTNRTDWTREETFLNEDLDLFRHQLAQDNQSAPSVSSH